MEINQARPHAQRANSSPPRAFGRQCIGKLTVFVILPSEAVCTIRNVPYPVSVDWIECQLELLCGIGSEICVLHYPDGSSLRKDKSLLLIDRSQNVIVLRLHMTDDNVCLWESVCKDDWNVLKGEMYDSVHHGANSDCSEFDTEELDHDKYFHALFLACSLGRYRLCQKILAIDADINRATRFGHTCLHAAVCGDRSAIVDLLLRKQADPNQCNALGQTPLQTAISKSAKRCSQKLRFVQFHRRSSQLRSQPVPTPQIVREDEPPSTPRDRAKELFTKYGIRETATKAWQTKHTSTSPAATPRTTDPKAQLDLAETDKPKSVSHAGFTMSTQLRLGNVDARRASSAATPSNTGNGSISNISQRTLAELGTFSNWKKIPRARILLQKSFSENQSKTEFVAPPPSPAFGTKMKVVDFRICNQSQKSCDGHAPHPSPESPSPPSHVTSPDITEETENIPLEDERNNLDEFESATDGIYDSRGSSLSSLRAGERLSPKPPTRGVWVSVKRKLRLAYLQTRAQKTKTGQNEAAFRTWLQKKAQGKLGIQSSLTDESGAESSDDNTNNEAFQKWLRDKKNAPQNQRVFRGKYKSVFINGSTMVGEAKHPDSMENKDAYKNWLRSRDVRLLSIPSELTQDQFKQSNAHKIMEAQKKQMLTSAVTYEEWMDAKYLRDRILKAV